MSKTNSYEFQSEVFTKIADGVSNSDIMKDLTSRRDALQHLFADKHGKCSHDQFKTQAGQLVGNIRTRFEEAPGEGAFSVAGLKLQHRSQILAGRILRALSDLTPANLTEVDDIAESYKRLSQGINLASLKDAAGTPQLNGQFNAEVSALYGEDAPVSE